MPGFRAHSFIPSRFPVNIGHAFKSENLNYLHIMQILAHLPLSAVGAMEQVCRHLRTVIIHARSRNVILQDLREISPILVESLHSLPISLILYDEGFGGVF